ncbi:MAG: hypothetical protein HKL92_09695 [Candidatus Eremiobacteraeota bacterium]|nr:hypothetical protein [Candidatus Eremiobacteraeota bacterium]
MSVFASNPFIEDNPVRPIDSSRLKATEGLVVGYKLHLTNELLSPRLNVYDELSKKTKTFSLSFRTKIDGTILKCDDFNDISLSNPRTESRWLVEQTAKKNHLCKNLPPDIIPGKTRVVLIYWNYNQAIAMKETGGIYNTLDQNPRSDAIWIVPDGSTP